MILPGSDFIACSKDGSRFGFQNSLNPRITSYRIYDNYGMSKQSLAVALTSLGVIILIFALGYAYYLQSLEQISSAPLPDQLVALPLSRRIDGRSALTELVWMHNQGFSLSIGAVGTYGGENEITLYVAGTPLKFLAGRLLVAMRDKIAEANSPFTPLAEREIKWRRVYELQGRGQLHYYFRSDNLIVWLAADETHAEGALRQVLDFYP